MAIEERVTCDLSGDILGKADRQRIAIRRNQDRPESAEYLDIGPCCFDRTVADLVKLADSRRPEDASGYKS